LPAESVSVTAIPIYDLSGPIVLTPRIVGQTDRNGIYNLEKVAAGRYRILAGQLTYYPGVKVETEGQIIRVDAGASVTGIDFRLAAPDGFRIKGRVTGLPASMPSGLLHAILTGVQPQQRGTRSITFPVDDTGAFESPKVTPGIYDLRILGYSTPSTRVVVNDRDLTGLEMAAAPVLTGRVTLDTGGALPVATIFSNGRNLLLGPPPEMSMIQVGIRSIDTKYRSNTTVLADGRFVLPFPSAIEKHTGDYEAVMSELPFGLHVKSIRADGVDLLQSPLRIVDGSPMAPLEIMLTTQRPPSQSPGVRVRGRVTGVPNDGAIGVRMAGRAPDLASRFGIMDLSHHGEQVLRADGTFEFENVPPGTYEVTVRVPSVPIMMVRKVVVPGRDVRDLEIAPTAAELTRFSGPPLQEIVVPPPAPAADSATLVFSQSGPSPEFMEGAITFFLVSAGNAIVEEKELKGNSVPLLLPAGSYELRSYVRACDGGCNFLSFPEEECRASFTVSPGETLRADRVRSGRTCRLDLRKQP
jgi:hypothetical protein